MKLYKVGGCVRDQILGLESKDIDYSVEANSFGEMKETLEKMGVKIYQIPNSEKYLTIRGNLNGEDADFVLCRKDSHYSDGRRPDTVEIGTIQDDLARRDFTMNAIAIDIETREVLDPFNGRLDIEDRIIRCVGSTDRLKEDSLRMLRALRFSITKDFILTEDIERVLLTDYALISNISRERIYEELNRMFKFSTHKTFEVMCQYDDLFRFIFEFCRVDLASVLKS
jgi:tRNA nucleotidyltransferase/poly(A) polymerase